MIVLKLSTIAAALVAGAAPVMAQAPPSDTLKAVIERGVTMEVMGQAGAVQYRADGTFVGFDNQYQGTYKVDGEKLCITAPDVGEDNSCIAYPVGKKSGDTFKITHPAAGEITITIK